MRILVVAPHPDDELLGCGGTLLKRSSEGSTVGWLLVTSITAQAGWSQERISRRASEVDQVRDGLGISPTNLYRLGFPTTELDRVPFGELVSSIGSVFHEFAPQEVLLPHSGDIHSDHRLTFDACSACTKWFRYPSVQRILTYETLSETEFGLDQVAGAFRPNLFVDISAHLAQKLKLLDIYQSELGKHPFPRSLETVRSQSLIRGAQRGVTAAEAFQILRSFE